MAIEKWLIYAILSAVAAAFVGIFGKIGMNDKSVDTTLATGVRSLAMTVMLMMVCAAVGAFSKINHFTGRVWLSIVLSGLAGATSWLFYFKSLQLAKVSQVAPIDKLSMPLAILLAVIILGDRPSWINWAGILLIAGGAYLAAWPKTP